MLEYLLMAFTGSLVGLVSSFFGVGACFIMVPVMIFFFETYFKTPSNLAPLIAFGTNMAVVVPTVFSGVLRHRKELAKKNVVFPFKHFLSFGIPVGFGSLTGAFLAYVFFSTFRATAGIVLKTIFGFFCLFGAYRFIKAKPIPINKLRNPELMKYISLGFLSGTLAHFIGIGGGIVYMPVLNTLLGVPIHLAVPVSLATMIIGSGIGSTSFGLLGFLDQVNHPQEYPPLSLGWLNLIAFLTIGVPSVLTAQIGPKLAHRTSPKKYKVLLMLIYAYIGTRLIIRGLCQLYGIKPILP